MLEGFGDEGVDEEREFLFCGWHFGSSIMLLLVWRVVGGWVVDVGCGK